MAFAGGQRLTAALLNSVFAPSSGDTQNTLGTTQSASYTATLTGGTACGVTFIAPASGIVEVANSSVLDSTATATGRRSYCTFRIRTGGVIGSGSDVVAASDDNSIYNSADFDIAAGRAIRVTGLTPGNTYNCQQLFRVNNASDAGSFLSKHLSVKALV